MKRLLSGIILVFNLFISGCGNEYLDNLEDIQTLVNGAYSRVNQFGVNISILNIKDITDSVKYEEYWVPEIKIIPIDRQYVGTYTREFTKNDIKFSYYNVSTLPNRYAIYQIEALSKYYVIYNEPLAVEGIYSVVLKSKTGFSTPQAAMAYATANLIPKLIYKSTTTSTTVDEHVKAVSDNFEIIEIFSPFKYTTNEERIKEIYPSLIINNLSV